MSVYKKLSAVKAELAKTDLKKSGKNKFANFDYFELSDFLPKVVELCDKHGICTNFFIEGNIAVLDIYDSENVEIHANFSCPFVNADIKGAVAIQQLGGAITYLRRYLYMMAFDIVDNDVVDSQESHKKEDNSKSSNNNHYDEPPAYYEQEEHTPLPSCNDGNKNGFVKNVSIKQDKNGDNYLCMLLEDESKNVYWKNVFAKQIPHFRKEFEKVGEDIRKDELDKYVKNAKVSFVVSGKEVSGVRLVEYPKF
ncbi:MAG: ERF family protein [Chitinivibrionia bacterium]|nr:ERF family protein [Chitinivibrionia bacterium]